MLNYRFVFMTIIYFWQRIQSDFIQSKLRCLSKKCMPTFFGRFTQFYPKLPGKLIQFPSQPGINWLFFTQFRFIFPILLANLSSFVLELRTPPNSSTIQIKTFTTKRRSDYSSITLKMTDVLLLTKNLLFPIQKWH